MKWFHRTNELGIAICAVVLGTLCTAADPQTGPVTESRFPPLKVPSGFKATLFACDPLIEYPSVISAGPRPGAIFVAVDYMTGLGTEITRRSEVRLVEDTNGDGYADKTTVFADSFNSIMGLAWHEGALFVMHAPFLTALRDISGDWKADERKDIVRGLGLTPEENPVRLHCANGVTVGHDGWLYLALGDHGCIVDRPEGDRLVLEGGGILRCRPDGRDLHIFSTGLRNIYDVALDAELNVFVRDNENDGGDYKIRVCQSFFGADHGYPYLYYEDPAEPLKPLADLGLGSSAGVVCYLEQQFPAEHRGSLFCCEWGKSLVSYPLKREGSSFASPAENEFAVGAAGDPYGFKPTDVVVQRDGTLMVSDYADGQRPKRGRGRIYHVAYVDEAKQKTPGPKTDALAQLDSASYYERCDAQANLERTGDQGLRSIIAALAAGKIGARGRLLHAVWILAHLQGEKAIEPLLALAESDPEPAVRAQAVRAIADLADPILAKHRLDAGSGDAALAARLAALGTGPDRRLTLEVIVALGRMRWTESPSWLQQNLRQPDAALSHAAMQAMRRSGNWPAVLKLLDLPSSDPLRSIALRAASRQYDSALVNGLLERLSRETEAVRLSEYIASLARVHKKPGPWVYWDYKPLPRPANSIAWERTEAIAAALNKLLSHDDTELRMTVLKQLQREKVPVDLKALGEWLRDDTQSQHVATILESLRAQPGASVQQYLKPVIVEQKNTPANRLAALSFFSQGLEAERATELLALAAQLEDGPVLAELLGLLKVHPSLAATLLSTKKLDSESPEVRAAAIGALAELNADEARAALARLLVDHEPQVRSAAATAAGKLESRPSIEQLLKLATDQDGLVRAASLNSLRLLKEPRAVPHAVTALDDRQTDRVALALLHELGGPEHASAVTKLARHQPTLEILSGVAKALTDWKANATNDQQTELDHAVAELQGETGSLFRWRLSGPLPAPPAADLIEKVAADARIVFSAGLEGKVAWVDKGNETESWYLAQTDVNVAEETPIELVASSASSFAIHLNNKAIFERKEPAKAPAGTERIAATLRPGLNQLAVVLKTSGPQSARDFQLRFRRKSSSAERERLAAAALARTGNVQRGRTVFLATEKSLCLKCHRLNDQGERVGPELTGLGSRFSRIHIIESILEPSRSIGPNFATQVLLLTNGQVVSGVRIAEDEAKLTLVDSQGEKRQILRSEIEEQKSSPVSTMPEGIEKRLSQDEFVDLVAFLASLAEQQRP